MSSREHADKDTSDIDAEILNDAKRDGKIASILDKLTPDEMAAWLADNLDDDALETLLSTDS